MGRLEAEEDRAGLELAQRSIVLLKNEGVLPIVSTPHRVAVIGPIADSARDLLGDYSHLVHMQTLHEMRQGGDVLGVEADGRAFALRDELDGQPTILDAIRERLAGSEVVHAHGTGIRDGSDAGIRDAVVAAGDADVAIVVVGERSGLTDDSTTGEFRDRRELGLHGRQQELLEAVVATETPVVLVVVSGRPLALDWAARHCAAILLAWVPGDWGPAAIVDVLVGDQNPGGKLPISIPHHVGQVPITYRHHPSGGHSSPKGDYVDGPSGPLWPFGFGLSYTTFELSDLRVDRSEIATAGGECIVRVDVANTGDRTGDEVVQLYVRDEEAEARAARHRAARFRPRQPRSRGAPLGRVHPPLRAIRLYRGRSPPDRRAGPDHAPCRAVVDRSAADDGDPLDRAHRPSRRPAPLPDAGERVIADGRDRRHGLSLSAFDLPLRAPHLSTQAVEPPAFDALRVDTLAGSRPPPGFRASSRRLPPNIRAAASDVPFLY